MPGGTPACAGLHDLTSPILSASDVGLFAIVFAEASLLLGFLLPSAVLGCVAGYFTGGKFGPRVFASQDARHFKAEYVTRAELFFARYGWPSSSPASCPSCGPWCPPWRA